MNFLSSKIALTFLFGFSTQAVASAGFISPDESPFSGVLEIQSTEYRINCSDGTSHNEYDFQSPWLFFKSDTTAPASNLRVLITNVTDSLHFATPRPFSDRAYDRGTHSEGIRFQWGWEHENNAFVMAPNSSQFGKFPMDTLEMNELSYLIYDRESRLVVEAGKFRMPTRVSITSFKTTWGSSYQCPQSSF